LPKSGRSLGINWDAEPMSVRLGDEEQGEETSDEEEEEDAVSRLQGLLLSNHDEDKDMDFMDVNPSLDTVEEDTLTATPSVASVQEPEEQV